MRFAAGARFGPYEILAPIGSGGMGEVYRARDNRLKRDVAVKVLGAAWIDSTDRLARFAREAELLAALNHPNIAAIYGIEEDAGSTALVLELVEGETLAEHLERGALPVREVVAIARQIVDALDAAHEKGIVHRDLKLANIKVREDGRVKVLDFGLAKALDPHPSASTSAASSSAATNPAMTHVGAIVGTAPYMSPEQVRGLALDKRTDVWAFGCVLFEMLSGRPAFAGATALETMAAILDRDPDWSRLPLSTPPRLRRLIRWCLEKDPQGRLRDIGDARYDLSEATDTENEPVAAGRVRFGRSTLTPWTIAALATAALLTSLLTAPWRTPNPSESRPVARTMIVLPDGQELNRRSYPFSVSPDGTRVIYAADTGGTTQLYVRRIAELEATAMPGTKGASNPFFSPDGAWVAFFSGGFLQKAPVDGGTPIQICPIQGPVASGSWSADGTIVFAVRGAGLFTVSAAGGAPRLIPDSLGADWPEILPDGKTVLTTWGGTAFVVLSRDGSNRRVVAFRSDEVVERSASMPWLQEARAAAPRVLGVGYLLQARYVRTGHIVYGQSPGIVRAVAFDPASASIRGTSMSLLDSVYQAPGAGAVFFAVSDTGLLTYFLENRERSLVWADREGRQTPIGDSREAFRQPALSPDGTRLAVVIDSETRRSDIWIYDLQRGTRRRFTNDEHNLSPVWTRDGLGIAFYRTGQLAVQAADGREGTMIVDFEQEAYPSSWADARRLLFIATDARIGSDIWELSTDSGNRTRPLLVTPSSVEQSPRVSPDGRWVAYASNESGRFEVYVAPYPELARKVSVSSAGGRVPVWSRDGRELFYRQGTAIMAAPFDPRTGVRESVPRQLFSDSSYVGVGGDLTFDAAPDGRFLMIKDFRVSESRHFVIVSNWFDALRRAMSGAAR